MNFQAKIPLVSLMIMGVIFSIGLTKGPSHIPSEMIDRAFPSSELQNLFDLKETIGREVFQNELTLVNVFGSWCGACNIEHPTLVELASSGEVDIIGINWRDNREAAIKWLGKHGNPYSHVIFDEDSELIISLGVIGAPESYLVDGKGIIRLKHTGVITPKVWHQKFRPMIKKLNAS